MMKMTWKEAAKLTKAALTTKLAAAWVASHAALYAGHESDAVKYVTYHNPTKADLLLTGSCWGLWGRNWEVK